VFIKWTYSHLASASITSSNVISKSREVKRRLPDFFYFRHFLEFGYNSKNFYFSELNINHVEKEHLSKTFVLKRVLPVVIGAVAGYLYYYFIGCDNGNCAIQSNPYFSTLYGALIGVIFAIPTKKKKSIDKSKEN
jgi:hypothetical protein